MKVLDFMNGRFGKVSLKRPYRIAWKWMTWGTLVFLFIRLVVFPFFTWWGGIVRWLNYIIWG